MNAQTCVKKKKFFSDFRFSKLTALEPVRKSVQKSSKIVKKGPFLTLFGQNFGQNRPDFSPDFFEKKIFPKILTKISPNFDDFRLFFWSFYATQHKFLDHFIPRISPEDPRPFSPGPPRTTDHLDQEIRGFFSVFALERRVNTLNFDQFGPTFLTENLPKKQSKKLDLCCVTSVLLRVNPTQSRGPDPTNSVGPDRTILG